MRNVQNKPNWPERIVRNEPNSACRTGTNGTNRAKQSQFQQASRGQKDAGRGDNRAKQTQFGSELCKTKPISSGRTGPQGRGTTSQLRKTNPISSSLTRIRRPNCAKQSQVWVGWDIWGTACPGADCAKRTQSPAVSGRPPSALAPRTSGSRRTRCAKRTEFPPCRVGRGPGSIVRNKANCPKRGTEAVSAAQPVTRRKNFDRGAAEMW